MRYRLLSPFEFQLAMKKPGVILLDLRDKEDFETYHLKGAIHAPYEHLEEWSRRFSTDQPMLVYCAKGNESILAARRLANKGFYVGSLIGGIGRMG